MKYFTKIAEEPGVKKSPLWSHEAGTSRSDAIKKDFNGMAFTGANAPMLSDTTSTTFMGDGSTGFPTDQKFQVDNIKHRSFNEGDKVTGVNKSDSYKVDAEGNKKFTGSTQSAGSMSKDDAIKEVKSKKESRGYKKDRLPAQEETLSNDLTKGGSLHKEAVAPAIPAILAGLARVLGMGAVRAGAGAAVRGAAGAGTRAIVAGGTRAGAGAAGAGSGGFWSNLLKPTWGKAGMAAMMLPMGGKGAKATEAAGNYGKMSKLPSGDMGFWEGAKNW